MDNYTRLTTFAKRLLDKTSLEDGLSFIAYNAKKIIGSERCSMFIYDKKENILWTTMADGVEKIVVPSDLGIVGQTLRTKKPIIENDPYGNPNFLFDIDIQTGYYTKNILTAPIFNSKSEIVGVFQLLNKKTEFDKQDIEFITFFAHYISGFIELNNLYKKKL